MAGEKDDDDRAQAAHEPRECMACRGSGRVTSKLGGVANEVTCPWCGGGGVRVKDRDAQAHWLDPAATNQPPDDDSGGDAAA